MSKKGICNKILTVALVLILSVAILPLQAASATYRVVYEYYYYTTTGKKVYSNYIDYTVYQKSNTITMKMHKSTEGKVAWSSSNTKVATVKSTGKASATVTVKGQGTCIITAKVDGKSYTASIRAGKETGAKKKIITMGNVPTHEVMVGGVFTLTAQLKPSSLNPAYIKWKSSDSTIAAVTQDGKVTLKKAGTVKITAYYAKNTNLAVSATFKVVPKKVYISEITLSGPTKGYVGDKLTFKAAIKPSNATNKTLTWTTSNSAIATVNSSGVVTCKATGKVTIKVTTNDGTKKTVTSKTLTIEKPRATALYVETSKIPTPLMVGDSFTLTATVKPDNARNKKVLWYSDDEDVVTIDSNGLIKCVGPGKATITAESADPEASKLKKEIPLTVYPRKNYITSIKISGPDLSVPGMDLYYVVKTLLPEDYDDELTWTSSNTAVAKVVEGDDTGCQIKALSKGTTTITAKTVTGLKAQISLEVGDATYPNKMSVKKVPTHKLYEDATFKIEATLMNVKDEIVASPLIWKSSDPSIASVADDGTVTAHKAGTVQISVTSQENTKLTYTETLTFNEGVAVTKLTIAKDNIPTGVVYTGDEFDLIPVIEPANASNKSVTWVSSDDSIASIDQNGHFKALKTGNVTITVFLNENPGMKASITIPVDGYAAQEQP